MSGTRESWGRYPRARHAGVLLPAWADALPGLDSIESSLLPYGLGRSYGDVCLNDGGTLIDASRLDRFLAFDDESGVLQCESGVTLGEILRLSVPRGWFLPVVPGTRFVTVGGAIANDVHGKNHHRAGTFGRFVRKLELLRSDGRVLACSPDSSPELFAATIGGLGLTGLILRAEIQLRRVSGPFIDQEKIRFSSLDEYFDVSRVSDESHEYTVAWIDCLASGRQLGRGILIRGRHSERTGEGEIRDGRTLAVRVEPPGWLLSRPFMRSFNELYYRAQLSKRSAATVHYLSFFFPLDAILNWNLLYGRDGFLQYQCVVPAADGGRVIRDVLGRIVRSGGASFLAVLKSFGGVASPGMLSFPRAGFTLSLDFPFRGERTLRLLDELDELVRVAGGAIYPAKDARMAPATFDCSFPRADEFARWIDPRFSSSFWRRVHR